jgi:hypothetical protein
MSKHFFLFLALLTINSASFASGTSEDTSNSIIQKIENQNTSLVQAQIDNIRNLADKEVISQEPHKVDHKSI